VDRLERVDLSCWAVERQRTSASAKSRAHTPHAAAAARRTAAGFSPVLLSAACRAMSTMLATGDPDQRKCEAHLGTPPPVPRVKNRETPERD
jgi:hypothetical protein